MYRKFCVFDSDTLYLESTSKGNQRKWGHNGCFLKADTMGYESIAEYTVSDFFHYVEGVDFAEYCTDLENKSAEFKNKEFGMAISVLLSRCRKLEGIIWEQKH